MVVIPGTDVWSFAGTRKDAELIVSALTSMSIRLVSDGKPNHDFSELALRVLDSAQED